MRYIIRGLVKLLMGIWKSPNYATAWVAYLIAINLFVPLAFWSHFEARVIAVVFLAGAVLMSYLTERTGFSRLLGLGHVLWYPLVIWLIINLGATPATDGFGIWIRILVGTNIVSLIIDTLDVVRWLRGDRAELASA